MEYLVDSTETRIKLGDKAGVLKGQSLQRRHTLTVAQRLYLPFKTLLSIILSLAGLVIASPLILVVAIAIKLDSKGPVFYKQSRAGKNGETFLMYKFRSMVQDADKQIDDLYEKNDLEGAAFKLVDDPRITKVGRFLRKTSIDELPQLLNILLGHMTIVGPRPLPTYEHVACTPNQRIRDSVTPGLTCFWQINGRNNITDFEERVKLDIEYIEKMSPITDLVIILKTIPVVISGEGAY